MIHFICTKCHNLSHEEGSRLPKAGITVCKPCREGITMEQFSLKQMYLQDRKIKYQNIMIGCLFGIVFVALACIALLGLHLTDYMNEVKRLESIKPIVAKPNEICPAWWFGKSSILQVRDDICGRRR